MVKGQLETVPGKAPCVRDLTNGSDAFSPAVALRCNRLAFHFLDDCILSLARLFHPVDPKARIVASWPIASSCPSQVLLPVGRCRTSLLVGDRSDDCISSASRSVGPRLGKHACRVPCRVVRRPAAPCRLRPIPSSLGVRHLHPAAGRDRGRLPQTEALNRLRSFISLPLTTFVPKVELNSLLGCMEMSEAQEKDKKIGKDEEEVEEEEYVLLELDDCLYSDISPGAPFVLSGLDTLTPTLTVGGGMKMIGEYEETVGACYLFSESVLWEPKVSSEMPPSRENMEKPANSNEAPSKEVKHLASLEKVLKFRPVNVDDHMRRAYQHKDREI